MGWGQRGQDVPAVGARQRRGLNSGLNTSLELRFPSTGHGWTEAAGVYLRQGGGMSGRREKPQREAPCLCK